jgi:hypothetical protein
MRQGDCVDDRTVDPVRYPALTCENAGGPDGVVVQDIPDRCLQDTPD